MYGPTAAFGYVERPLRVDDGRSQKYCRRRSSSRFYNSALSGNAEGPMHHWGDGHSRRSTPGSRSPTIDAPANHFAAPAICNIRNDLDRAASWNEFIFERCQFPNRPALAAQFENAQIVELCEYGCNSFALSMSTPDEVPGISASGRGYGLISERRTHPTADPQSVRHCRTAPASLDTQRHQTGKTGSPAPRIRKVSTPILEEALATPYIGDLDVVSRAAAPRLPCSNRRTR
ncbi:hypothetical protein LMG24238_00109 [Paraburkholderia sediminicola]|uniref:Uncharacterized protein n=1 Tax=Paraburkholderia sediminicola TaxID=458836 RepID=A0A6J5A8F2_9BURK|nr:hypothetical protein LMG24238_00109 [Paraburkholderia sediminicola]